MTRWKCLHSTVVPQKCFFIYYLSVYFPESPSFIKTPSPVEGVPGKDASLHCEVYGTAPFQVNWYKDKRPLKDSRKHKMVCEGTSATLHITKLQQDDAGLYECKVSNNVGAESCRTTISLKGWCTSGGRLLKA